MNPAILTSAARIALKGAKIGQRVTVAANGNGECLAHEIYSGSLQRMKELHPGAKVFTAEIDAEGNVCMFGINVTERSRVVAAF